MHILYTTFNEDIFVKTFYTEREAGEYALEMLGSDYADRFGIDEDGHFIQDDGMRYFNVDIYSSILGLVYANIGQHPDILGTILRKLGEDLEANGERMEDDREELEPNEEAWLDLMRHYKRRLYYKK